MKLSTELIYSLGDESLGLSKSVSVCTLIYYIVEKLLFNNPYFDNLEIKPTVCRLNISKNHSSTNTLQNLYTEKRFFVFLIFEF